MSDTTPYYVLLLICAIVFVLQAWAIIKIRYMMRQVIELYDRISKPPAARRPELRASGMFRHTCQICRHRQTFLNPASQQVFVYRCGVSGQRIELDDHCEKFEFDPHVADT